VDVQEQLPSTQPSKLRCATGAIYPAPDFGIFHHGKVSTSKLVKIENDVLLLYWKGKIDAQAVHQDAATTAWQWEYNKIKVLQRTWLAKTASMNAQHRSNALRKGCTNECSTSKQCIEQGLKSY
jgi:hypothetical protein